MSVALDSTSAAPSQATLKVCVNCRCDDGAEFSEHYVCSEGETLCDRCGEKLAQESDEHGSGLYLGIYEF